MGMVSSDQARAAIILGFCAGAAGLVYLATRGSTPPAAPTQTPVAAAPVATLAPAARDTAGAASTTAPPAPSVDVVRVEPGGEAVVAGRAAPGATVTLYADDKPIADVTADAQGNFVAMFQAPPASGPQSLTLGAKGPTGEETRSNQVVVLLPSPPEPTVPPQQTAAAAPAATAPPAAEPAQGPQVAATAILSPESAEVTPTTRPAGMPADRVSLASISYANAGTIALAGFGLAGAELKAYVNDALAREGRVDAEGRWKLALDDVTAGLYRLRIDQLDQAGRVSSRIETPFQRDLPAPAGGPAEASAVVVQPGNNLWTLARLRYGAGMLYTRIYAANSDLIRDPDMIYPGQVFRMPERESPEPGKPPAE